MPYLNVKFQQNCFFFQISIGFSTFILKYLPILFNPAELVLKITRMRALVSQTHEYSIMILLPEIVLLSSLDPKTPKALEKFLLTVFEVYPKVYNGRSCGLCWKSFTDARAGFHRPVMLPLFYILLVHNNIEIIKQASTDLYYKMLVVCTLLETRTSRF